MPVQIRLVADWIEKQARATGVDVSVERISVEDGDHIVMRAYPADTKHTFLLGHTDTVHPIGTNLKNPTRIEGDKFYGCGIFDMKSGIVLMLEALRFFAVNEIKPSTSDHDSFIVRRRGRKLYRKAAGRTRSRQCGKVSGV